MAEGRNKFGSNIDKKKSGFNSYSKRKSFGDSRDKTFDEKKKPYSSKRSSEFEADRKPYSQKGISGVDADKKPYGQKRGSKFDAGKKSFDDKRFSAEKKSQYNEESKYDYSKDIEASEEANGEIDKLEGRNSIMEALKANRTINKIFVAKGEREGSIRQIIAMAREKKIIITEVDHSAIDSMASTRSHQGIIAFVAVKEYVEVDDILKIAQDKGQPPFIIILDEISDPHNFGAILRTANAVGAHGVIIPKRRAIGLTSAVSKASAGAIEYVPVARVTNITQTIEYLKKNNVWVVGTDSTGDKAFYDSDLKGAIALVVGSEGEGMSRLIREKCDFVVNIPMQGEISSLNASVAAAIVMYEILKQRG